MTMIRLAALAACCLLAGGGVRAQERTAEALWERECTVCHSGASDSRAPSRETLAMSSPEAVVRTLAAGAMQQQGAALSAAERRALAAFLTGRPVPDAAPAGWERCTQSPPMSDPAAAPALERVGRERRQHALSAGRPGAAEPRGRTAAGAQVGLRFSPRQRMPGRSRWSRPAGCSPAARTATSMRSTPAAGARTGSSPPVRPCAPRSAWRRTRAGTRRTSATWPGRCTRSTPRTASSCGPGASTITRWRGSRARRPTSKAGSTCRCRRWKKGPGWTRTTNAAGSAAASPPSTRLPGA